MPDRQTGELTAQEAKACVYRAQGRAKVEAVRLAFERFPKEKQKQYEKASRLFAKPQVQARVRELLDAAKPADIRSIGAAHDHMIEVMEEARKAGNYNAFMAGKRMELQVLGALKDGVALSVEARTSDAGLLKQLAGDDPAKLAALRTILGSQDGFDEDPVPIATGALH